MRRTPMKLYSESSDSAQSFDDAWLTRFSGDNKDVAELHFERLKQVEVWPVLNTPPSPTALPLGPLSGILSPYSPTIFGRHPNEA